MADRTQTSLDIRGCAAYIHVDIDPSSQREARRVTLPLPDAIELRRQLDVTIAGAEAAVAAMIDARTDGDRP